VSTNEVKIRIKIDDEELELILPGMGWTYEEAKLAKQVSDGMTPLQVEAGIFEMDPDAWMAVLRVSYARAGSDFPGIAALSTNLVELTDAVTEAIEEVARSRPPTRERPNGSDPREGLPESDTPPAQSSETTIPETGGSPLGVPSSAGIPGADSTD